jgi:hypothetical protein
LKIIPDVSGSVGWVKDGGNKIRSCYKEGVRFNRKTFGQINPSQLPGRKVRVIEIMMNWTGDLMKLFVAGEIVGYDVY